MLCYLFSLNGLSTLSAFLSPLIIHVGRQVTFRLATYIASAGKRSDVSMHESLYEVIINWPFSWDLLFRIFVSVWYTPYSVFKNSNGNVNITERPLLYDYQQSLLSLLDG